VRDVESSVIRPEKELKGFEKVELNPGEEKEVIFTLDKRAFAYYNVDLKDWHVESGEYEVLIGKSSRDIVLKDTVYVKSTVQIRKKFHRNSTIGDVIEDPVASEIFKPIIQQLIKQHPVFATSERNVIEMFKEMMRYMPLRNLISFSNGAITEEMLESIIQRMNQRKD